jgi:peptide/nickel transport system substrate-binding protein
MSRVSLGRAVLIALLLAIVSVPASGVAGPSSQLANPSARVGGTLISGAIFGLEPKTLNPNIRQDDGALRIAALMHVSLVATDFVHNTGVHPALAEKWQVSPDGKRYTFTLVRNATWHDGKPVTSADVKWTFDTIIKEKGGPLRTFEDVTSITTPDPYTVVMTLRNSDATLLGNLGTWTAPFILPKHIYEGKDWLQNPANDQPVGAGPFKFVQWVKGSHIILEANQNFYRGRPALQRFIMRFYSLPNLVTAYEAGEVRYAYELFPFSEIFRFKREPKYVIDFHYRGLTSSALFNTKRKPMDDVRVRRALSMAVDRAELSRRIFNGTAPPNPGGMPFNWARTDQHQIRFDAAAAERLLEEAGYRRGADGVRFKLTMTQTGAMSSGDMTVVIQEMWRRIGVELAAESMDFPSLLAKVGEKKDFDIAMNNTIISHEPGELCRFVCSDGDRNFGQYANSRLDELFDRAKRTPNQADRKRLYEDAQRILVEDVPRLLIVEFPYHQPIWAEVKDPFWTKTLAEKPNNNYQGFLYTYLGAR